MPSPSQVLILASTARRGAVRQALAWVVVALAAALIATSPTLVVFGFGREEALLRETCVATATLAGAILSALLASEGVPTGLGDREPLLPLASPVPRWVLVLGRYLGLLQVLMAAHLILSATIAFTVWRYTGVLPPGLAAGLLLAFATDAVLLAMAVALAVRLHLPAVVLGTAVFLALGHLAPVLRQAHPIWTVLPDLTALDGSPFLATAPPPVGVARHLAYAALWATAALAAATFLLERRE